MTQKIMIPAKGITAKTQRLFLPILVLLLCFFSFTPQTAASPPVISSTRPVTPVFFDLSIQKNHSELLILFDTTKWQHTCFSLENPHRLVIDIPGMTLPEKVVGVPVNRPELDRLRIAQNPEHVRFVLDLPVATEGASRVEDHPQGLKISLFQTKMALPLQETPQRQKTGGITPRIAGGDRRTADRSAGGTLLREQ